MLKRNKDRKGAAAAELAVLLPFLLFVAIIATDWARILYYTIALDNCARSGAIYLSDDQAQARSPYADVTAAAKAEAPNLTNLTVTSSTAADGGDGANAVTVTVSMPFNTLTKFKYPKWFGMSTNTTITRSVQMRVMPKTPT